MWLQQGDGAMGGLAAGIDKRAWGVADHVSRARAGERRQNPWRKRKATIT